MGDEEENERVRGGAPMKLSKKHIGQVFDVRGGDGSWHYILLDKKKDDLLFYTSNGKYTIDTNKYSDWQPFKAVADDKAALFLAWELAKQSPRGE